MINIDAVKITPGDEEVLRLLAQGCSNKEIAGSLKGSANDEKEIQVTTLVWEGLTNREIAKIVGTTEQVIKN